jgi:hypothetical protein
MIPKMTKTAIRIALPAALALAAGTASLRARFDVPAGDLTFSHALHVGEMEIGCAECHAGVAASALASDRNVPGHDVCASCHDDAVASECGLCHADPENPTPVPVPEREVVFSHRGHLEREMACGDCHRDVADADRPSPRHMPDMPLCARCHDGRSAPDECTLCHSDTAGLARRAHPEGWMRAHKYRAAQDDAGCRPCHRTTDACLECHEGDNLVQTSHPLNYRFFHAQEAKGKEKECAVCHANPTFCNTCHDREEIMPLNHSGASWPDRGHGIEAVRDLESCAACHDEADPTCLRCHTDFDDVRGTDPNIHGPGFSSERGKGPWHDDRSAVCYRCHNAGSILLGTGFCEYCHESFRTGGAAPFPAHGGPPDVF